MPGDTFVRAMYSDHSGRQSVVDVYWSG